MRQGDAECGHRSEAEMKLMEILRDQGSLEAGGWGGHPHKTHPHPGPGHISGKASEVLGSWVSTRSMPVSTLSLPVSN